MAGYVGYIVVGIIVLGCAVYLLWKFRRIFQGKDTGCPLCEFNKTCKHRGKRDGCDFSDDHE